MTNSKTALPPAAHALIDPAAAAATVTDHLREAGQAGETARDALATVSTELGRAAVQTTVDTVHTGVSGTHRLGNNLYGGGQAMANQAGSGITRGDLCVGLQLQIAGQKTGRAAGWTRAQAGQAAAWTRHGTASLVRPLSLAGLTVSTELDLAAVQTTVDTLHTGLSGTRRLGSNLYEGGQAMANQAGSGIARSDLWVGLQLQTAGQKTGRAAGWTRTQAGQAAAWTGHGPAGLTVAGLGLEAFAVFLVSHDTMHAACALYGTPHGPHDMLPLICGLGLWGVLIGQQAVPAGMSRASAVAAMAATQLGVAVYSIGHLLPSPEVKMAGMVTGLVGIVAQLVYRAQTFTRTLDGVGVGRLALQGVALGVFICSSREVGLRGFDGNLEDGRRGTLVAAGITLLAVTAALWPPAVKTRALPAADTAGAFSA